MAREYEWKRDVLVGLKTTHTEYAITDSSEIPPEGEGWKRVYSFGFGSVSGSGGSPARQVRGNRG